ncbi:o-spanin [Pseudomonas phage Zuri]|uniref:O-spanin n=1 Tax=Pseudomonas phage Zuri TaxID=2604899 RepID=A0ACD5G5H3_9CAUD
MLNIKPLSMAIALITISACSSQPSEPTYINVKPEVPKLNGTLLQSMQPNSTDLLKRGESWYESSGKLLDSVTEPSPL